MSKRFFATYATDKKKEREGAEIEMEGVTFIVRRTVNNPEWQVVLERCLKKHADIQDTSKRADLATKEAFFEYALVGWSGLVDQDGEEIPFSKESARILLEEVCPDALIRLFNRSADIDNYILAEEELDLKNLLMSSATKKGGRTGK